LPGLSSKADFSFSLGATPLLKLFTASSIVAYVLKILATPVSWKSSFAGSNGSTSLSSPPFVTNSLWLITSTPMKVESRLEHWLRSATIFYHVDPLDPAKELFHLTGISKVFNTFETAKDAIKSFNNGIKSSEPKSDDAIPKKNIAWAFA